MKYILIVLFFTGLSLSAQTMSIYDIAAKIRKLSGQRPEISNADRVYEECDWSTAKSIFRRYQSDIIGKYDIKYKKEAFDCDDFALAYKVFSSLVGINNKASYAVGYLSVMVDDRSSHALNIIVSSNAIWAMEPQTGEFYDFEQYVEDKEINCIRF